MRQFRWLLTALWLLGVASWAEEVTVAVAASFYPTAQALAEAFTTRTGYPVRLSSASTGALYNQIRYGAGYDILLAADTARPKRLEEEGRTVPGSRFTYAMGELVLLPGRDLARSDLGLPADAQALAAAIAEQLSSAPPRSVALANPALAPYGAAAQAVYDYLGLWESTADSRVMGSNIAQAYQFVVTGNARLGLVARAQIIDPGTGETASHWPIPATWHPPIAQQAVWLEHGAHNPAAGAFIRFLSSPTAHDLIEQFGYRLP